MYKKGTDNCLCSYAFIELIIIGASHTTYRSNRIRYGPLASSREDCHAYAATPIGETLQLTNHSPRLSLGKGTIFGNLPNNFFVPSPRHRAGATKGPPPIQQYPHVAAVL